MESPLLGVILDSSVIIAAERKRQTLEYLLISVERALGEIEIAIAAVTLAVATLNTRHFGKSPVCRCSRLGMPGDRACTRKHVKQQL